MKKDLYSNINIFPTECAVRVESSHPTSSSLLGRVYLDVGGFMVLVGMGIHYIFFLSGALNDFCGPFGYEIWEWKRVSKCCGLRHYCQWDIGGSLLIHPALLMGY